MVKFTNATFIILLLLSCTSLLQAKELALQHGTHYQQPANINHYWVSEKLDGIRGRWTGKQLITRNGNTINAPQWFISHWPNVPLDGEIWLARDEFQATMSCVKTQQENHQSCWQKLSFMLFDLPEHKGTFTERLAALKVLVNNTNSSYLKLVAQTEVTTFSALENMLTTVINNKGEGLMLHHKGAYYQTGRTQALMKLKRKQDAEARVVAHIPGKGKFTGMLGALKVKMPNGITFRIGSGFSDKERQQPPPVGSVITYQYIGKTKRGVPKFASFLRIRSTK